MNLLIVGGGVVGTATAQGFQRLGHHIDIIDPKKECLAAIKGLTVWESSEKMSKDDKLRVELALICTPERIVPEAVHDLYEVFNPLRFNPKEIYVRSAGSDTPPFVASFPVYMRSSVVPGTCARLKEKFPHWHFGHNPEFFREAVAEYEFLNPSGVVLGNCCPEHGEMMMNLYAPLGVPVHFTRPEVSELAKLCVNVYLATQVSFWNQVKILADSMGINSHTVGMLTARCDSRISPYGARMHGKPYGGHCLPKDVDQLLDLCREYVKGKPIGLFKAVREINEYFGKGEK